MSRLTEEERGDLRYAAAKKKERAEKLSSGIYTREDADLWITHLYVPSLYALRHDDLECLDCHTPMKLYRFNNDGLTWTKRWRCETCLASASGQFTTHVIQEQP